MKDELERLKDLRIGLLDFCENKPEHQERCILNKLDYRIDELEYEVIKDEK